MKNFSIAGSALLAGRFEEATISIAGAHITTIARGIDPHADIRTDGWIAPGLIDLQVNGAFGLDFTAQGAAAAAIAERLPATGVTAFLPTIITSPLDAYAPLLRDLERAAKEARGAHMPGVHLEGPYLNRRRVGAHNPHYLRAPSLDELEAWAGSPCVRLVTLAPELPGALDMVRQLCAHGITVSVGHSDASYSQTVEGFQAGIGWGTHLFNAMSPLTHREPGLAGALLASDIPCGLIVDGIHVDPAVVKIAYRAKGAGGITLVTDAMAAMGMNPGRYKLGDRDVVVDATCARLTDHTLAGSILQMDQAVRNVIEYTGCSLADALTMASATPARVAHLQNKGHIEPGYDADLVVMDKSLNVETTIIGGEIAYRRIK